MTSFSICLLPSVQVCRDLMRVLFSLIEAMSFCISRSVSFISLRRVSVYFPDKIKILWTSFIWVTIPNKWKGKMIIYREHTFTWSVVSRFDNADIISIVHKLLLHFLNKCSDLLVWRSCMEAEVDVLTWVVGEEPTGVLALLPGLADVWLTIIRVKNRKLRRKSEKTRVIILIECWL